MRLRTGPIAFKDEQKKIAIVSFPYKLIHRFIAWGTLLSICTLAQASPVKESNLKPHLDVITLKGLMSKGLKNSINSNQFWPQIFQTYGSAALVPLLSIAKNEKEHDELRWASIYGIARLTGKKGLGVIQRFTHDRSWLMRDAALRSFAALNAKEMKPVIEASLHDKALVVRTTAVDVIGHLRLESAGPRLVDALFDPVNYRGGKPLWIQDHIFSALTQIGYRGASPRLVELLEKRKDPALQKKVVATLERLNQKTFGTKPMDQQIYLWKRNTIAEKTF